MMTIIHCPACTNHVPDDTIWVARNKFYCSEECAKRSYGACLS